MNNESLDISKIFNFDTISKASNNIVISSDEIEVIEPENVEKKKRGRPRKNSSSNSNDNNTELAQPLFVPLCQTNDPYEDSYNEGKNLLRGSIMQIDNLSSQVQNEIENIRKNKTLKSKYTYIANLCDTASSLINAKVSAIREINSITTHCHDLEIKRLKEIKSNQQNQQDDDKYMADLYNAYINTPVNNGAFTPLSVSTNNTIGNLNTLMSGTAIVSDNNDQSNSFESYINNMTPEQNRMILEGNPNIETVVVYDQSTGSKMFDVIDITTGSPVPNYPRPSQELLADTNINFSTGVASNANMGQSWKVVIAGDPINNF